MRPGLRRHGRLAADLGRAALGEVDLPFKLTVCLTFRCHHRCAACAIWARDPGQEMTAEQLDRLFASARATSWLDLTGGEVVARTDLDAIAGSVHRHLDRLALLHFPTGGMGPRRAVEAARLFVRQRGPRVVISVSIDGPPAVHDRLRGVEGAWQRAVHTLRLLREVPGVQVFAGMTLQPGNTDQIDVCVAALASELPGFRHADLHVNYLHRSAHYFGNMDLPERNGVAITDALREFVAKKGPPREPFGLIERAYLALAPQHMASGRSPIPCRSAELSAYIGPEGTVYPCTIDERPLGHLADFDYDLEALWQSAARREMRAEVAADRCPGCWTPCEAYQTLLTSPAALARALARSPSRPG